jgi:hypothetical protein
VLALVQRRLPRSWYLWLKIGKMQLRQGKRSVGVFRFATAALLAADLLGCCRRTRCDPKNLAAAPGSLQVADVKLQQAGDTWRRVPLFPRGEMLRCPECPFAEKSRKSHTGRPNWCAAGQNIAMPLNW